MSTLTFYADLPVLDDFSATTDPDNYQSLPADWSVVAADIEDSTGAIAKGRYKAVNIVGVSIITAVQNIRKDLKIPSVFGGDGAILCIPVDIETQAREALASVIHIANVQYGLNLRAGIVPIDTIEKTGLRVLVSKHRMSSAYVQAAFAGGGVEYAEQLIKSEDENYRIKAATERDTADFSGLECRWDNVPSQHGETISLIVKAMHSDSNEQFRFYADVIELIRKIYGTDELSHPLHSEGLKLNIFSPLINLESRLKSRSGQFPFSLFVSMKIRLEMLLGGALMHFGLRTGDTEWGNYKQEVVENSDFKKFDGVLRHVLSGTSAQREKLCHELDKLYDKGECVYGIHRSDSALVTCLIENRSGEHYHFVDGANGGYAMAAAQMKNQLKGQPG